LEGQLEKSRPRKQIKVRTSLNSKFINIAKIKKTQLVTKEARLKEKDKEKANKSGFTLDCILIE
jgi:hypothetical protein